jgi:transposase
MEDISMKAICNEVRRLMVRAYEHGKSITEIAYLYDVSTRSVYNILRLYRETGSLSAKPHKGRISRLTDKNIEDIIHKIETESDVTLHMIVEDLNLPIKKSQLHKFLKKRGISFKKKLYTPNHNSEKT